LLKGTIKILSIRSIFTFHARGAQLIRTEAEEGGTTMIFGCKPVLLPANPEYRSIEIKEGMRFEIWGVVTGSFRRFN